MEINTSSATFKVSTASNSENKGLVSAPKGNFENLVNGVAQSFTSTIHADLVKLSRTIQSGKSIPARELLYYQIRAGQFGLQVELASKLGESLSSTIRKLEQGH